MYCGHDALDHIGLAGIDEERPRPFRVAQRLIGPELGSEDVEIRIRCVGRAPGAFPDASGERFRICVARQEKTGYAQALGQRNEHLPVPRFEEGGVDDHMKARPQADCGAESCVIVENVLSSGELCATLAAGH